MNTITAQSFDWTEEEVIQKAYEVLDNGVVEYSGLFGDPVIFYNDCYLRSFSVHLDVSLFCKDIHIAEFKSGEIREKVKTIIEVAEAI